MMKNKKILIVIIVTLFLTLVGFVTYNKYKSNTKGIQLAQNDSVGLFNSIKDALTKNVTLTCEFENDGYKVRSYIKNGAIRVVSDSIDEQQVGQMILKDKKMYMWDVKSKKGFIYNVDENAQVGMGADDVVKSENYLNLIEEYKDSCKVDNVDDSNFDVPQDVEFQDMSKFLEELKSNIPSGDIPR